MARKYKEENIKVCEICGLEYYHIVVAGNPQCNVALAVNEWECLWTNVEICNGCNFENRNFVKPCNWPKK